MPPAPVHTLWERLAGSARAEQPLPIPLLLPPQQVALSCVKLSISFQTLSNEDAPAHGHPQSQAMAQSQWDRQRQAVKPGNL